jgi:hypothetical protein
LTPMTASGKSASGVPAAEIYAATQEAIVPKASFWARLIDCLVESPLAPVSGTLMPPSLTVAEPGCGPAFALEALVAGLPLDHWASVELVGIEKREDMLDTAQARLAHALEQRPGWGARCRTRVLLDRAECPASAWWRESSALSGRGGWGLIIASQFEQYCPNAPRGSAVTKTEFRQQVFSALQPGGLYALITDAAAEDAATQAQWDATWDASVVTALERWPDHGDLAIRAAHGRSGP